MSPVFYQNIQYISHVNHLGEIESMYDETYDNLRPAISLTSSVTASGTGTSEDPYVVK